MLIHIPGLCRHCHWPQLGELSEVLSSCSEQELVSSAARSAYPHGIETRFRDAQLGPLFGDLDGFVHAAQATQYRTLKYQIETLRYAEPISGYVITGFDFYIDCLGLRRVASSGPEQRLVSESEDAIDIRDASGFWPAAPGTGVVDHVAFRALNRQGLARVERP